MEQVWNLLTFSAVFFTPSIAAILYFLFYRPVYSCQEFMYGKYAIHWTCVGASLAGYCLAPLTLLWPSEFIRTGVTWLVAAGIGFCIAAPLAAVLHIPVLHYNRSSTIFHYLQDRFHGKFLRYCAFIFNTLIGLLFCISILTLSADLAQRSLQVTTIAIYAKRWACILVLAALLGITSVVGGQKAAVFLTSFTLLFEFLIALICAVAMGIVTRPRNIAGREDYNKDNDTEKHDNDRIVNVSRMDGVGEGEWFTYLTPNFRLSSPSTSIIDQENLWLATFASVLYFFYIFGCHQVSHQHYCSLPSKRQARLALASTSVVYLIVWSLSFILVCLMINFYTHPSQLLRNCSSFNLLTDPFASLIVYFSRTWSNTNGAVGYFLASFTGVCAFCCLPTSFVSLATSAYEDIVKSYCINAQESRRVFALKCLTILFAALTTIGALLTSELILVDINDKEGGQWWLYVRSYFFTLATWMMPFAALYVLAIWLPCTNSRGATVGLASGVAVVLTLSILHLVPFPFDPYIQRPNSLLFRCCDETATGGFPGDGQVANEGMWNQSFPDAVVQENTSATFGTTKSKETNNDDGTRPPATCSSYKLLQTANANKDSVNLWHRIPLTLQAVIAFLCTILIGLCISLVTGRQDIYALDWNLVYWTCNHLDNLRFWQCFKRGPGPSFDGSAAQEAGGSKKKRNQPGPYKTSESFRYSKQGPFPDTNYLNPKVQGYMATLTRMDRS